MINIMMEDNDNDISYQVDEITGEPTKKLPTVDIDTVRAKLPRLKAEREEMMKDEFRTVVVHEFGDEYHLSEEERKKKYKYYEAFKTFSKYKHKFRKFPEYIKAMREALKCLDLVAKDNFVYSPDEFKKLFFRGKIWISGLILPEFKGAGRRSVDTEYLTEYILSDAPAEDFLKEEEHEIYTKEELEDAYEVLFTEEDKRVIDRAINSDDDDEAEIYAPVSLYEDDENIPSNMCLPLTKKEIKKSIKVLPDLGNLYKRIEKKRKKGSLGMGGLISDMLSADIEEFELYGNNQTIQLSPMPLFKGDMMNDTDYYKYLAKLEDWESTQIKTTYNGKLKTKEEIDAIELRKALENHNWDIRNLFGNKERMKKLEKIRKEQLQKEKLLKKKLISVQNANKRRKLGEDFDDEELSKEEKKLSKKTKKLKKKAKKTLGKLNKETKGDDKVLKSTWDF